MVESGLLFSTATLVTVSIYLSGSLATTTAIDSLVQLAVNLIHFVSLAKKSDPRT